MRTHWKLVGPLALILILAACGQMATIGPKGPTLIASTPISRAALVDPVIIDGENPGGNRTCEEVGIAFETSFEFSSDRVNFGGDSFDAAFPDGLSVSTDGTFVSFGSTFPIGAVIVKGSSDANVYYYDPAVLADEGLSAPNNASGGPAGLSNLTFCWNGTPPEEEPELDPLTISKTAFTKHRETWTWSIDKSAEPDEALLGEAVAFEVVVTPSATTSSMYLVNGAITIGNPNDVAATVESVVDLLDGVAIPVECGVAFPYVLEAGGTLECTYEATSSDGSTVYNVATVTTSGDVEGATTQVAVDFAAGPYGTENFCVSVVDNLGDASLQSQSDYTVLGVVCADPADGKNTTGLVPVGLERTQVGSSTVFSYALTPVAPEGADGCEGFEFVNRAKVLMRGLFADDTASVWVYPGTVEIESAESGEPVCQPTPTDEEQRPAGA